MPTTPQDAVHAHSSNTVRASEPRNLPYTTRNLRRPRLPPHINAALRVAAFLTALTALLTAYRIAPETTNEDYYLLFWLGFAGGLGLLSLLALSVSSRPLWRTTAISATALYTLVPKLAMSPTHPIYFDETAHFEITRFVVSTGNLFQASPLLPIGRDYPGLQAVTAALNFLSGAPLWDCALAVVALAHVSILLIIYRTARELSLSERASTAAALSYVLMANFVYGDAQYSYESLALPFLFAAVLCFLAALNAASHLTRLRFSALGLLAGTTCIVTHHLSALGMLLLLALVAILYRPDTAPACSTPFTALLRYAYPLLLTSILILWIGLVAPATVSYLLPHLTSSLRDLSDTLHGLLWGAPTPMSSFTPSLATNSLGLRSPFEHSDIPLYEHLAGLLAPFILFAVFITACLAIRRSRASRRTSAWYLAGAALYFVSLPLTLLPAASTGAHRSWATTFFAVSLTIGTASSATPPTRHRHIRRAYLSTRPIALGFLLVTVLMGDVTQGTAPDYRFPGPYEFGSDTRSVTAETLAMADWVKRHLPPPAHVVTDRYTAIALTNLAAAIPAVNTPQLQIADFWYDAYPPPPNLLAHMQAAGFRYIVIDDRTALYAPLEAELFYPSEPAIVPATNLTRLRTWPWLHTIYRSTHYVIYRVSFHAYDNWYPTHRHPVLAP
jgi:hypothetical protein